MIHLGIESVKTSREWMKDQMLFYRAFTMVLFRVFFFLLLMLTSLLRISP